MAYMKKLALIAALLLAASPAVAQVATSGQQQLSGQSGESAPTTGIFCDEEMTATFCNVPSGPNTSGYGSGNVFTSTGGSGSSGVSGPSGSAATSPAILPCGSEPPFDELCN
jgi:hypothetical protein